MDNKPRVIPLSMLSSGQRGVIVYLTAGRGLHDRLTAMGLGLGSKVEVIYRGAPGPFLVAIKETRLAIGQGIAHKIMVNPE